MPVIECFVVIVKGATFVVDRWLGLRSDGRNFCCNLYLRLSIPGVFCMKRGEA